jgi:hypothetical protein
MSKEGKNIVRKEIAVSPGLGLEIQKELKTARRQEKSWWRTVVCETGSHLGVLAVAMGPLM